MYDKLTVNKKSKYTNLILLWKKLLSEVETHRIIVTMLMPWNRRVRLQSSCFCTTISQDEIDRSVVNI